MGPSLVPLAMRYVMLVLSPNVDLYLIKEAQVLRNIQIVVIVTVQIEHFICESNLHYIIIRFITKYLSIS